MHSVLENDWDLTDIADVKFRAVGFAEDPAQTTITNSIRRAWTALPPTPDADDVETFMREDTARTLEEQAQIPQNPDTDTLHTPWRDKVYFLFNHLFYDVANFMWNLYGVGHLHPPNSDILPLGFPAVSSAAGGEHERVVTKVWETEVLILPAYLAPGVTVRAETYDQGEEDGVVRDLVKLRGRFNGENPAEIWYIAKGVETRFYIEGDWEDGRRGMAAVLAYGILDSDCPHQRERDEGDEEEDENENE